MACRAVAACQLPMGLPSKAAGKLDAEETGLLAGALTPTSFRPPPVALALG